MDHAYKWILKWGGGLAFVIIILWPILALPAGVFNKGVHALPCAPTSHAAGLM
jgi:hypothetical protein